MFNIPERYWNGIKKLINNIHKDINVMSRFFGTLEHSGNAILGMLGQRLAKAYNDAHVEGVANINKMTKMMKERGWGIKDNEDLIQKINGKNSDYLDSSRDFAKYDLLYRTEQAKAIMIYMILKRLRVRPRSNLSTCFYLIRGLRSRLVMISYIQLLIFPHRVFTILGKNFIINIFSEPIIASKRSNSLAFIRIIAVRGIIS